jgi:hypothetical protein
LRVSGEWQEVWLRRWSWWAGDKENNSTGGSADQRTDGTDSLGSKGSGVAVVT